MAGRSAKGAKGAEMQNTIDVQKKQIEIYTKMVDVLSKECSQAKDELSVASSEMETWKTGYFQLIELLQENGIPLPCEQEVFEEEAETEDEENPPVLYNVAEQYRKIVLSAAATEFTSGVELHTKADASFKAVAEHFSWGDT